MSFVTILQLTALTATVVIATCALYQILKMGNAYGEQRKELTRAVSIIKDFQHLHPELISLLQRLDSIGMVREAQTIDIQELRRRIEAQEEQLAQSMARISGTVDALAQKIPEPRKQNSESSVMRRGILSQDPDFRFGVLKDWLCKNAIAIRRRAAQEWRTTDDLIAMIPLSLEAEAELVDDNILLIGTRGHADRFAIAIRDSIPPTL